MRQEEEDQKQKELGKTEGTDRKSVHYAYICLLTHFHHANVNHPTDIAENV
jgi:hypothetical protein